MTAKNPLLVKNQQLRERMEELEETLHAIRSGEVDALVVSGSEGEQIFTLKGALDAYRVMVETMSEGAVTLARDSTILYCNNYFTDMVSMPHDQVIGMSFTDIVAAQDQDQFDKMMARSIGDHVREELTLQAIDGKPVPAYLSMHVLPDSEDRAIAVVVTDLAEIAAAAEAQSRLALIVESSDDAIISTTLEGVVQSWNRAAVKLFGYSTKEAIGQDIQSLIIPPEHIDEFKRKFDILRRGERTHPVETERRHKDNSLLPVSVMASPIINTMGKVVGASVNIRDITERVLATKKLHDSEENFRTIFETVKDVIFILDTAGNFVAISPSLEKVAGFSPDKLVGKPFAAFVHPDDLARSTEVFRKVLAGENFDNIEIRALKKSGDYFHYEISGNSRKYKGVMQIVGIARDISERKASEASLNLFRELLDQTQDAIEVIDPKTLRYLDVNQTACRTLGYSRDELLAMSAPDIYANIDELPKEQIAKDLQAGRPVLIEAVHRRKDGSTFPVEVSVSRVQTDRKYNVAVSRDITERKQAEEKLHSTMHQLNERLKEIKCLYTVSTLVEDASLSVEQIVRGIVETMPQSWQYPEVTCARISLEDKQYKSKHFKKTPWRLAASIEVDGKTMGEIEVYYLEEKPDSDEGPFLREEVDLIAGVARIITDYLKRRQAEQALQRSEQEFRSLAESMPQIVWTSDSDGSNNYFNQQWVDYTGLTQEESLGDNWNKPFHPDDQPGAWEAWQTALKHSSSYSSESRLRRADGTYRWWLVRGVPVRNDNDNSLKWFGTCTDIHDLKMAELEITKANLELRESDRRFSDLLGNVELISIMLDREGCITYCNEYLLQLTGWQYEELIGQNWFELHLPAGIQDSMKLFYTEMLAEQLETRHHEHEILTRSGERRLIAWNNTVLHSVSGDVIGVASIGEDITERKAYEARIKYLSRVHAVLSGINSLIVHVHDRDELFKEACRIAIDDGEFRMAMLCVVDRQTNTIDPVATAAGKDNQLLANIIDIVASNEHSPNTMVAQSIRVKQTLVSNDLTNEPRVLFGKQYAESGVRSMAILPLIVSGEAVGALALYASEIEFFHDEEMMLLTELASDIAFAIDYIEKQEKLDYLAYYDELTGLANRNLFLDRVSHYMRSAASGGRRLALCLIDLERFKNINDSLGRPDGDRLLRQVAEWLTDKAGDDNMLARIDADRFAIVLPEVKSDVNLVQFTDNLLATFLEHSFHLNDTVLRIGIKVGIALFPDDGETSDNLFKNAEAALKNTKASGNRYLFYTQEMNAAVADKLKLENQLRQAIDNEEFVLHYQPKVNLSSGEVTSAEALIRWNDPHTGLVGPGQFIPILEETGMIYEVGRWALRKATEDNLRWRNSGLPPMRIAVNVSALQLRNHDFGDEISQVIGIDAQAADGLELEITESLIMADVEHSISILQAIRAMGVTIAIDDFGTGFSSLSYLAKLPVTTLKIDRAFIIDMTVASEGLALVSTIISLAHALNLKVVAEGVETEEQLRLLRSLNCDEMQGFLFSKPVPCEEFETRFLSQPPPVAEP